MCGWIDGCVDGWRDGWMGGCVNGVVDGWMCAEIGWMDG